MVKNKQNIFIKAEITDYEGNGEYWVRIADEDNSRLVDKNFIFESIDTSIFPEEVSGILGRILDEVNLPPDIESEVSELYQKSTKLL